MIDAINFYSSNHCVRNRSQSIPFCCANSKKNDVCVSAEKVGDGKSDLRSFLLLSGCFGAFSLIADTLANSNQLMKSNFTPVKDILKFAGIWSLIGAAVFGVFKGIEELAMPKVSK